MGGSVPQRTGFLYCTYCLDDINFQRKLIVIPPDPPPFANLRPEPYVIDSTNWLTTQDGDIIDTQDGESYITSIPNPADDAATSRNFRLAYLAISATALLAWPAMAALARRKP